LIRRARTPRLRNRAVKFQKLFRQFAIFIVLLLPLSAPALVMRANGPEPIIVQIKESLRTSDDLDNRLNELASLRQQNKLSVAKWWAGGKLLVMLSFPANFTERQAIAVIAKLQQLPAVEKVVAVSAFNLEFRSGDFVREYGPNDTIPDVARRGFDADRIDKPVQRVPDQTSLLQIPHVPNRLIVGWKEEYIWKADTTGFSQRMADFHRDAGCRVVREFRYSPTKLHQVLEFDDATALADKLKRYVDSGLVGYAQPDYLYKTTAVPNDPAYASAPGPQWTLPIISAPQAWDLTTGDPSVIIAVGDSGANVNHPEFSPNLWSGQNNGEIHNFISNSTNVADDDTRSHGSNVASIIGAQGGNGSYMTGVAWDISLMILKVVNSQDQTSSDAIAEAVNYAWQHGATAINLSVTLGVSAICTFDGEFTTCEPGGYDPTVEIAFKSARDNNMVVVCGAGNFGGQHRVDGSDETDNDDDLNRVSPASIPTDNNISVLATDRYDHKASYSSMGRYRVDLGAPAGTATDLVIGLKQTFNGNSFDPANYSFLDGTSVAAPHVTSALALVKSRFPWESYSGLRDRVLMGTDHIGALQGLCRTNGRLNVYKALQTRSMLRNLSTRARVEGGDRVMIAGFVIGGSGSGGPLKVVIRGLGPSLQSYGINAALLGDPVIELHKPDGSIETNDNWQDDWNAGETVASGFQPGNSNEAVMVRWLSPGVYTVVLRDAGSQYGVGLFEIYELQDNTNEQSRLLNLSTRCLVGTGDEQAIAGTIIGDLNNTGLPKPDRRLLMFGKGPSLAAYGLQGVLGDPQIQVLNTGEFNDQWRTIDDNSGDGDALEEKLIEANFAPAQPAESALWPTFSPGAYTVKLSGANQSTGIGLIEFYEY